MAGFSPAVKRLIIDRDANGPPDDAIPMPDHIADQIRKAIA